MYANAMNRVAKKASTSELCMHHGAMIHFSGKRQTNFIGNNHYIKANDGSNDDPSIHAECDTISKFIRHNQTHNVNNAKIRRKLKKARLLIAKVNKNTNDNRLFGNSYPCINCLDTIKNYGIKKIVVTNELGEYQCKKGKYII
jgi:deoxycytidylate deaminase